MARRSEDAIRLAFVRELDEVRQKNALGIAWMRFAGTLGWVLLALASMGVGPRPDFEAKLPWIIVYAVAAASLLGAGFLSRALPPERVRGKAEPLPLFAPGSKPPPTGEIPLPDEGR